MNFYIEELDLDVDFDGNPHKCDDGIGYYEFWGQKGFDSNPYISCEDTIDWNKSLYTKEENEIIDNWLIDNYGLVDEKLCENYD